MDDDIRPRRTIPPEIIDALTRAPTFSTQIGPLYERAARAEDTGSTFNIERAERQIAEEVYRNAARASIQLQVRCGEQQAATALMDMAALLHGNPYGAHRLWLDRTDIMRVLKTTDVYVSQLTRQGAFDTIIYGSNPTPRGTKRWCSAASVQRYKTLKEQGVRRSDIIRQKQAAAV